MLRIKADQNIYRLQEFLAPDVELELFDPDDGLPDVKNTDILLVRTVSRISPETLPDTGSLKFIGTASSGSDHLDTDYLTGKGLEVADAKGCNARAVAEYVLTSMLLWSIKRDVDLSSLSCGIIGVGAAGSEVDTLLNNFSIKTVRHDPPRAERDPNFNSAGLDEALACDILTFHVPLSCSGAYSTLHWLNQEKLKQTRSRLVINAARGGVIDEESLMKALDNGTLKDVIIDVWENEPDFNPALADKAFIATPHIAGYSEQAKLNATRLLMEKLSQHFNLSLAPQNELYAKKELHLAHLKYSLYELLLRLNPLREYDADLREIASRPDKEQLFRKLRIDRPYRYEYRFLLLEDKLLNEFESLQLLGITANKSG